MTRFKPLFLVLVLLPMPLWAGLRRKAAPKPKPAEEKPAVRRYRMQDIERKEQHLSLEGFLQMVGTLGLVSIGPDGVAIKSGNSTLQIKGH